MDILESFIHRTLVLDRQVTDLKPSIAGSGASRPPFRDLFAHRSDLNSPAVPG
jgi:hypothetical protein